MPDLVHSPVNGSPFEEIVDTTLWDRAETVNRLRVADELGWLVMLNYHKTDIQFLVGFSAEAVNQPGPLSPPLDMVELEQRAGPQAQVAGLRAPFNADMAAKGLGSRMSNTPQALRPSMVQGREVAVRSVPFASEHDLYRRDLAEADMGQGSRLLRHGFKLLRAMAQDNLTGSTRGSERAVDSMERDYGNKPLVLMSVPPSWDIEHRKRGISQPVAAQTVLVRGGRFASVNLMQRLGDFPVAWRP